MTLTFSKLAFYKLASVFLLVFALGLSGCGKNMHVRVGPSAAKSSAKEDSGATAKAGEAPKSDETSNASLKSPTAELPSINLTTKKEPSEKEPVENKSSPVSPEGEKQAENDSPATSETADATSLGGKQKQIGKLETLEGISVWDEEKTLTESKLPYLNPEKSTGVRNLGNPVFKIAGTEEGFVSQTNLLFRALVYVPANAEVKSVKKFELVLNGLRKFEKTGEASSKKMSGQIICLIAPSKVCSGEKDLLEDKNINDAFFAESTIQNQMFSSLELQDLYQIKGNEKLANGTLQGLDEVSLEMPALFGFELENSLDWIRNHSLEYAQGGFYKLTFVAANRTYFKSGKVVLELEVNGDSVQVEAPVEVLNGEKDKTLAVLGGSDITEVQAERVQAAAGSESGVVGGDKPEEQLPEAEKTEAEVTEGSGGITPTGTQTGSSTQVEETASAEVGNSTGAADAADLAGGGSSNVNHGNGTLLSEPEGQEASNPNKDLADGAENIEPKNSVDGTLQGLKPKSASYLTPEAQKYIDLGYQLPVSKPRNYGDLNVNLAGALSFDLNSDVLKTEQVGSLGTMIDYFNSIDSQLAKIIIIGRADKTGKSEYNKKLSQRRAERVRKLFESRKFKNLNKIQILGLGEVDFSSCGGLENCIRDRRVDFEVEFVSSLDQARKAQLLDASIQVINSIWNKDVAAGKGQYPASIINTTINTTR